MDIYLLGNWAFVDMGKGYMLCIGTKEDVDAADAAEIGKMVQEAIAVAKFRSMGSMKGGKTH